MTNELEYVPEGWNPKEWAGYMLERAKRAEYSIVADHFICRAEAVQMKYGITDVECWEPTLRGLRRPNLDP